LDLVALRRALLAHPAASSAERQHVAATLALLDTPAPTARTQLDPGHLTASAFVVSPDRRSLLLIHHRTLGLWLQPGGHLDPADRSLEQAARRELAEETGVRAVEPLGGGSLLLDIDVHQIPPNPRRGEGAHRHFDVRFALRALEASLRPSTEVGGARWVPLVAVDRVQTDASVRAAATRLRARLATMELS